MATIVIEELRRREAIRRLIMEGPDRLAFHVYRRMWADRGHSGQLGMVEPLTWREIADWAQLEGLLDGAQAQLLRGESAPPASTGETRSGALRRESSPGRRIHGRDPDH
jgi:hypothetical protein